MRIWCSTLCLDDAQYFVPQKCSSRIELQKHSLGCTSKHESKATKHLWPFLHLSHVFDSEFFLTPLPPELEWTLAEKKTTHTAKKQRPITHLNHIEETHPSPSFECSSGPHKPSGFPRSRQRLATPGFGPQAASAQAKHMLDAKTQTTSKTNKHMQDSFFEPSQSCCMFWPTASFRD